MAGVERDAIVLLRALADEDRLRIVGMLALRPRDPADLALLLGVGDAALERHLAILKRAGLVRASGGRVRLDTGPIPAVMAATAEPDPPPVMVPADATPEQRKVLSAFFQGERLARIPAQVKKLRVVLERLAGRFDVARIYTEKEVNEILREHHPDVAALRRGLVDHRFLVRRRDRYRRLG